jgi:hypothetical protein
MVLHIMETNSFLFDLIKQSFHNNVVINMDFIYKMLSVKKILKLVKLVIQMNG